MSLITKLRTKLARTKSGFLGKIAEAVKLRGKVDDELMEEIEEILIRCDTGVEMTQTIMDSLTERIRVDRITDAGVVQTVLGEIMQNILLKDYAELGNLFDEIDAKPYVIAFVGVNGVGKTTSIGKMANALVQAGKRVMIIAGDTFRAAAIEQLAIWAERAGATLIRSHQNADPASVIYDGIASALARDFDVVMIDTAGRQHTRENLMLELSKIDRTIKKLIPEAPHQSLLVVDATTGQNAISQAVNFHKVMPLTGLVLSKYDGTSKGGIIFNLKHNLDLPVRFIGVGEGIGDLEVFDAEAFVQAFFETSEEVEEEQ
ncbi:MAG: signal recognition particle-docking protein FtsY [Candidatus Cloacimonadaceae bacterium]|jgi:fused signal recognition particle receptor|nr:signal recognition particle-docking protein FtsY [Candidatus Cloacimonadota bacterium]MDX9950269.1 signal recognition particle-docking protein FtsY [Candidatus Syntrophosphaera sp.]NLN85442.1 signal recognition particle-docking protein FtsY [Candidatus Cloacimonadota bacterium]